MAHTVFITGAARRIGRALALFFSRRGDTVVAHYNHSQAEAQSLREECPGPCILQRADLSRPETADDLFRAAVDEAGPIDLLINNASIFPRASLQTMTIEGWTENLTVNAFAPFQLMRKAAAQDGDGSVINILDTRILDYDREHADYHISKRVLHTLTRMGALEFAPHWRVNAIAPGLILPPPGADDSYLETHKGANPLNTHGAVEDICRAAAYLTDSPFVSGQILYVDGGRHLKGNVYGG